MKSYTTAGSKNSLEQCLSVFTAPYLAAFLLIMLPSLWPTVGLAQAARTARPSQEMGVAVHGHTLPSMMRPHYNYFFGRNRYAESGLGIHYRRQLYGLLSAEVALKYDHEFSRHTFYTGTAVQQAGGFSLPVRLQLQSQGKFGINLGAGYVISKGVYSRNFFNCERIYWMNQWPGLAWQYGIQLYGGLFYPLNDQYQLRLEADFAPLLRLMRAVNTTEIQITCFRRLKSKNR